ncbi:MAG: zinc ABC transporter substrate-binding protein, partial [Synergistaceae bacterium]|nr:zinc ABC transporter substrate-binding protein [Synergistaceae bacterium]
TEEIIEGMQHEHEHEEHEHEAEIDEHIWLSLKNACVLCKYIFEVISDFDPEHKYLYAANVDSYMKKLSDLDTK